MESKRWYESKVLWFNTGAIGILLIDYFALQGYIPLEIATPVIALVNVILRKFTNKAVTR